VATNPDTTRHHHEAELAAIALLPGQRYSLPGLIAAARVKPRRFRQIRPTEALKASLAAPYFDIVRAWRDERQALLDAFDQAVALGDTSIIKRQVDASTAKIAARFGNVAGRFAGILASIERWHRIQWTNRVRQATSLDVSLQTTAADVRQPIQVARDWNEALFADVHNQTSHRIVTALVAAAAAVGVAFVGGESETVKARRRQSAGAAVDEVLAKAKRRAAGIGVDQCDKVSRGMDTARRQAAGVDEWIWHHLDPQPHPRPEHQRREGQVFSSKRKPPEMPGELPFCKCWSEPKLD
jgi:hypothetical protein